MKELYKIVTTDIIQNKELWQIMYFRSSYFHKFVLFHYFLLLLRYNIKMFGAFIFVLCRILLSLLLRPTNFHVESRANVLKSTIYIVSYFFMCLHAKVYIYIYPYPYKFTYSLKCCILKALLNSGCFLSGQERNKLYPDSMHVLNRSMDIGNTIFSNYLSCSRGMRTSRQVISK